MKAAWCWVVGLKFLLEEKTENRVFRRLATNFRLIRLALDGELLLLSKT